MTSTRKPTRAVFNRLVAHADRQPVAVIVLDVRGGRRRRHHILYANAFAEQLLGFSPGQLIHKLPAALFGRATDLFGIMRARDAVIAGARCTFTLRLYRRDGEPLLVDGAAGLVEQDRPDGGAQAVAIAVVLHAAGAAPAGHSPAALVALQRLGADLAADGQALRISNRPHAIS